MWEPITRGEINVPDSQPTRGLIMATTELSSDPDTYWSEYFRQPSGISYSSSWRLPRLVGRLITIEVTSPEELPSLVGYVDDAIGYANQQYQQIVLPQLQAEQEQREAEAARAAAEVQKAKDIAKGL